MHWHRNPNFYILFGFIQFGFLMMIAEFLYPDFSTSGNYISDLGVGPQPSQAIFTVSIIIFGLLAIVGAYYYSKTLAGRLFPILIAIAGIGGIGVGLFNEHTGWPHATFAFFAFFFSALAAIYSYKLLPSPTSIFAVILGLISIAALVLLGLGVFLGIGVGGMERMIFYPVLFWGIMFAGSRMAVEKLKAGAIK
ncbi:MAG: DUF998 domain-containing protein [Methanomassiliicoccales archaeon]|nr:DUF998 domain-containing protein [Methanomassiliicoccales archaeon]